MSKFVSEFKEFIMKGNVLDMAVGVIVGGAFGSIVSSLVDDVLGPIIGLIVGGLDFSKLSFGIGDAQIMPITGPITSFTREVTIALNAPPTTTPTARSMTLPFMIKSLNS